MPCALSLLALVGALHPPRLRPPQAKSGPCLPEYPHGAQCTSGQGKVRYVDDGDTLDADVPGDGLGGLLRVRIIGIQAMEQTSYRAAQRAGDCHAVDATNAARAAGQAVEEEDPRRVALPGEPLARPPAALDRGPPQAAAGATSAGS